MTPLGSNDRIDATPRDVQLESRTLFRAQALIARLREGDELEVDDQGPRLRLRLRRNGKEVAILSAKGQERFEAMRRSCDAPPVARVHKIFM